MKFHHCLFKLLRKNQTVADWLRITKGNDSKRIGPKPLFFYYKCSSCGYKRVCQILWNSVIAFSRYWKPKRRGPNTVCRGIIMEQIWDCIFCALPVQKSIFLHDMALKTSVTDLTQFRLKLFVRNLTKLIGPHQANLVLIAYVSSEGSGEPAHPRSLARTFAARSYKQWVKRNLQTESQIPGPSEWLGMRS